MRRYDTDGSIQARYLQSLNAHQFYNGTVQVYNGNLQLRNGASPALELRPSTANGWPRIDFYNASGSATGQLQLEESSGNVELRKVNGPVFKLTGTAALLTDGELATRGISNYLFRLEDTEDNSSVGWARAGIRRSVNADGTGNKNWHRDGIYGASGSFIRYYASVDPDENTPWTNYDFSIEANGEVRVPFSAQSSTGVVNKGLLDSTVANYLPLGGGTLSGALTLSYSNPSIYLRSDYVGGGSRWQLIFRRRQVYHSAKQLLTV